MTLVELLITVAIVALVMGVAVMSLGVTESARLKRSATLIAGAVRVAYGHANATNKTVRLVFDFDQQQIILEESADRHLLQKGDVAGGAVGATEIEKASIEAAEKIIKGPRAPRASFQPAKVFGWNPDKDKQGKELSIGVRFFQVETSNSDDPLQTGRAYLYFFPGGQTERASIQLSVSNPSLSEDGDFFSITVSPLTGKTQLRKGRVEMERPRDETEASERDDRGF